MTRVGIAASEFLSSLRVQRKERGWLMEMLMGSQVLLYAGEQVKKEESDCCKFQGGYSGDLGEVPGDAREGAREGVSAAAVEDVAELTGIVRQTTWLTSFASICLPISKK